MNVNASLQMNTVGPSERARLAQQEAIAAPKSSESESRNKELMVAPEYAPVEGTFELLKMMLETSKADRQMKKKLEATADVTATKAEQAQVEALRGKASRTLAAGLIEGASTMAGGVISMGAGFDGMVKPLNKAQEAGAKAVETLRESGTKGVVAWMNKGAADYDVEAKVEETRAGALRRSEGSLKSDIDQLKQNDQKMFDLVRDVMAAMERCSQIALQTR